MADKFNLTWHTFHNHSSDLLSDLYNSSNFADVTLVADDQTQFKCHKFVLSACSSVFRNILKVDSSSPLIYLRGIGREEIESMLQFMYLGEASLYQERMNEFLNVAKDLDLKEIGENVDVDEEEAELIQWDSMTESNITKDNDSSRISRTTVPSVNEARKFTCNKCPLSYINNRNLERHVKSSHEGIKYQCQQCDYKASQQTHMDNHVKSKHDGVRYPCEQCDYKASFKNSLYIHLKSKHEGVRYPCQQCDYEATQQSSLKTHMKSKHEGVKYPCQMCDYKATYQCDLYRHVKAKHKE